MTNLKTPNLHDHHHLNELWQSKVLTSKLNKKEHVEESECISDVGMNRLEMIEEATREKKEDAKSDFEIFPEGDHH